MNTDFRKQNMKFTYKLTQNGAWSKQMHLHLLHREHTVNKN